MVISSPRYFQFMSLCYIATIVWRSSFVDPNVVLHLCIYFIYTLKKHILSQMKQVGKLLLNLDIIL